MKRYTEVMPHHKRKEHCPWWLAVFSNVQSDRQRNSWDAFLFDSALNQRDGLMSYGSSGTEQRCLGAILHYRFGYVFP